MKRLITKRLTLSIILFLSLVLLLGCSPTTESDGKPELKPKIDTLEGAAYTGHYTRSGTRSLDTENMISSKKYRNTEEMAKSSLGKGSVFNAIDFSWNGSHNCEGFRLYRSANGAAYEMILDWDDLWPGITPEDLFGAKDYDIKQGNTYRYYVIAYNKAKNWETAPSDIFTITIGDKTFLPPVFLNQPSDYASINKPNYVFKWIPIGDILPYGDIVYGKIWIRIFSADTLSTVMWFLEPDDFTTSQIIYNGVSLIHGQSYRWYIHCLGYDSKGNLISESASEDWEFIYN